MPNYTLDDLRNAADSKFGHTHFEDIDATLLNPLRLPKEKKAELKAAQEAERAKREAAEKAQEKYEEALKAYEAGERKTEPTAPEGRDDDEVFEHFANTVRIVAKSDAEAERLLEYVDGDVAVLITLIDLWQNGTQAGEASASES